LVQGAHGQTIAHAIERGSEVSLQVEHGSLYPHCTALRIVAGLRRFWGTSENNRKGQVLPPYGRGLQATGGANSRWEQVVRAIGRILNPAPKQPK